MSNFEEELILIVSFQIRKCEKGMEVRYNYLKDMNLTARVGANLLVYSPCQGQHF